MSIDDRNGNSDDAPRDEELRRLYAQLPSEEPRRETDDAIRAAARRAVEAGPHPVPYARTRRWAVPIATAASLLFIAILVREQQPERDAVPAVLQERAAAPQAAPAAPAPAMHDEAAPAKQPATRSIAKAEPARKSVAPAPAVPSAANAPAPALAESANAAGGASASSGAVAADAIAPSTAKSVAAEKKEELAALPHPRAQAETIVPAETPWPETTAIGNIISNGPLAGYRLRARTSEPGRVLFSVAGTRGTPADWQADIQARLVDYGWAPQDACPGAMPVRLSRDGDDVELRPGRDWIDVRWRSPGGCEAP